MRIVLAGGSGSLGRALARSLASDHEVVVLTRTARPDAAYRQVVWDGKTVGHWAHELEDAVVINLAGELVDRRPTPANVALLTASRVEPTQALVAASKQHPPALWVQMSTLAAYGDAGQATLTEASPVADGPPQMAGVATAWEHALVGHNAARCVVLRAAVVLEPGTPALNRLVAVTRWGLGGRIGSGRQWFSWLHVDDFVAIVHHAIVEASMKGLYLATSPQPVTNAELMATLRQQLHRPWAPPTPTLLVRLGSIMLCTDPALALTGRQAVPQRLFDGGFTFLHPELDGALADLLPVEDRWAR